MRISRDGVPVIILSHRKREFLPQAVASLRQFALGVSDVIVVDDSGDDTHHHWLDDHGYQFSLTHSVGRNVGYLQAMHVVWTTARRVADEAGVESVLLWEEDFVATRTLAIPHMGLILQRNADLAHLNLQRQPVYRVERQFGYMESHVRRGYDLSSRWTQYATGDLPWVSRRTPFTTNPGLIRREVLDIDWPTREEAGDDAEAAMSKRLEAEGYYFGWYGSWNTPSTRHIGTSRKTGIGY